MNTNTVTDPRVDAIIEKADDFAKPIMRQLRSLLQHTVPEATETIRSGFASFDYKGPFCSVGIFKDHVSLGFWKQKLLEDAEGLLAPAGKLSKITSIENLPEDGVITGLIEKAARLNDFSDKPEIIQHTSGENAETLPEDFAAALALNILANNAFENLDADAQKEYLTWIGEAQTNTDRTRRIETGLHQISQGKTHKQS